MKTPTRLLSFVFFTAAAASCTHHDAPHTGTSTSNDVEPCVNLIAAASVPMDENKKPAKELTSTKDLIDGTAGTYRLTTFRIFHSHMLSTKKRLAVSISVDPEGDKLTRRALDCSNLYGEKSVTVEQQLSNTFSRADGTIPASNRVKLIITAGTSALTGAPTSTSTPAATGNPASNVVSTVADTLDATNVIIDETSKAAKVTLGDVPSGKFVEDATIGTAAAKADIVADKKVYRISASTVEARVTFTAKVAGKIVDVWSNAGTYVLDGATPTATSSATPTPTNSASPVPSSVPGDDVSD